MVDVYNSLRDDDGNRLNDRVVLFMSKLSIDGEIEEFTASNHYVPEVSGTALIVDKHVVNQVEKLIFIDGELLIKEGEELISPVKTEKELKREELLRQIAELDATEDEPAYSEEQTDAPLLDYTEQPSE